MLVLVSNVLTALSPLGEACYCHISNILGVYGKKADYQRRALFEDSTTGACPGRGQRAADFACGKASDVLQTLISTFETEVFKLTVNLT